MTRQMNQQTALIALARTRRMQRALAHAHMHRNAPMPTLRLSLGFMTSTATTGLDDTEPANVGHSMSILGVSRAEGVAYIVEDLGPAETPIIYRLWLAGHRRGHLVPIHAWYEQVNDAAEIRARIASIATTLEPAIPTTTEAWMLSTRVVQRRALRVSADEAPIRKFALQLRVETVTGIGASGQTTVTAFLRPGATLAAVHALPGEDCAIARVTYTGIPHGLGQPKDTMILLTE